MKRFLAGLPILFFTVANLLAQNISPSPDDSATPAQVSGGAVAALLGGVCLFYLIIIAIWLFIAIWIMRDAKRRQSPNATLVTILGWIPATTIIGLIVHLVTRPKTIPGAPNP
jgi:heme/copper-type cytochrome/quinol oxidase subunit 2